MFGYVLLYLGHCAVATVAVCGFGSWSLEFHCGMPRQISPLPPTPSQTEVCYTMGESIVRVPGREFRFLAPIVGQHLFLNLNQLILWRRIRICLLSFRQSCECCQTNGFARPVLRDRVSLATKVTCATAHSKVCSFCPHFRLFCSIIINFSKKYFCSPMIEVRILNRT